MSKNVSAVQGGVWCVKTRVKLSSAAAHTVGWSELVEKFSNKFFMGDCSSDDRTLSSTPYLLYLNILAGRADNERLWFLSPTK